MLRKIKSFLIKVRIGRIRFESIGDNVIIEPDFRFAAPQNLSIGDNCYIGPEARLNAIGGIVVSSGVIIGPRCTIYSANHRYENANAIPYDEVVVPRKVIIGKNSWIGGNVVVVPGVIIGEGCIIAAGAVVTRNIPPFSVAGGNPACVIKKRDPKQYAQLEEHDRIYMRLKSAGNLRPIIQEEEL